MKTCISCDVAKPLSEFWHDRFRDDGYSVKCKLCHKGFQRKSEFTGREYRTWLRWLPPILKSMQEDEDPRVRAYAEKIIGEMPEATQKKLRKLQEVHA